MAKRSRRPQKPSYVAYEFYQMRAGTRVAQFPSEGDAARLVLDTFRRHGANALTWLALVGIREDGSWELYANGQQLIDFARRQSVPPAARPVTA